ncbi:hypothetical protein [Ascidiaceihabitans sp.]|uniref:hypothetical protein n=1 Tax=Ascidiaceihabitans sp. TaxID=1872644 RepID=UPI003297A0FB
MKLTVGLLALALGWSSPANADLISINIGGTGSQKTNVKWQANLISIDEQSGVATFSYETPDGISEFQLHTTRIYSILFRPLLIMNEDYPSRNAHRGFEQPLPTRASRDRSRGILLDNSAAQADFILPSNAIVQPPNRVGDDLKVYGVINSLEDGIATLTISSQGGATETIKLDAGLLLSWVRG